MGSFMKRLLLLTTMALATVVGCGSTGTTVAAPELTTAAPVVTEAPTTVAPPTTSDADFAKFVRESNFVSNFADALRPLGYATSPMTPELRASLLTIGYDSCDMLDTHRGNTTELQLYFDAFAPDRADQLKLVTGIVWASVTICPEWKDATSVWVKKS
jgi:hypothetical protein